MKRHVIARLGVAALIVCSTASASDDFYRKRVAPILERRCHGCHNNELKNGGISLADRESLSTVAKSGMLIRAVRGEGEVRMPPGPPLKKREIRVLTEWVKRGAPVK